MAPTVTGRRSLLLALWRPRLRVAAPRGAPAGLASARCAGYNPGANQEKGGALVLTTPYVNVPIATNTTLLVVALCAVALLLFAVLLEIWRKRRQTQRRLAGEWRTVETIAREKELTEDAWPRLRRLIERRAPDRPFEAVTVRHVFNRCVDEEIEDIRRTSGQEAVVQEGEALRNIREHLGLNFVPFGQRIDSTREIYEGQIIWMAPAGEERPQWRRVAVTEVTEAFFAVSPPEDGAFNAKPGARMECRMWREEDARYLFTVSFVKALDAPPSLMFAHTSELTRVQSRQFRRVRYDQDTSVGVLEAPAAGGLSELGKQKPVTRMRGRITNLSAGGVALVTQMPLPKASYLRVELRLPEHPPMTVDARIVSSTAITGGRTLVRAEFVNMEEADQETIARFAAQREQARLHAEESIA